MIGACENSVPESLFAGTLADPHSVLGIHDWNDGKIVRVYDPLASTVEIPGVRDIFSRTAVFPFSELVI